jgi:hypothetical protein
VSIVSTTKELITLAQKGATIELELRLIKMQEAELEQREEILTLKNKLVKLEEALKINQSLSFTNGMYVKDDVHYCQLCWDSEKLLIRLQECENQSMDEYERVYDNGIYYHCLKCKSNYGL